MAFRNRLGGHSNSYHTYSLEEALEGIAAGYKFVVANGTRLDRARPLGLTPNAWPD